MTYSEIQVTKADNGFIARVSYPCRYTGNTHVKEYIAVNSAHLGDVIEEITTDSKKETELQEEEEPQVKGDKDLNLYEYGISVGGISLAEGERIVAFVTEMKEERS